MFTDASSNDCRNVRTMWQVDQKDNANYYQIAYYSRKLIDNAKKIASHEK